jgi:hypothetical protein
MKRFLLFLLFFLGSLRVSAYETPLYAPNEPCSMWISGELLYWRVFEAGLEYADSYDQAIGDLANADAHEIRFHYKPGFRVQAGYLDLLGLDIGASYTYYKSKESDSVEGTLFAALNYFGSDAGGDALAVTSAEADWDIHFHNIDLDIGQVLCFSCIKLHPHIGIRGACIDQRGNFAYDGGSIVAGPYTISLKNDFWGVGIKGGFDSRFQLSECFSLFGGVASSLLYGHFKLEQIQNQAGVDQIDLTEHFHRLAPTLQANLGLSWDKRSFCGCHINISIAAEWQYWWNQNQTERFTSGVFPIHVIPEKDLGLFGGTLRGTIYF